MLKCVIGWQTYQGDYWYLRGEDNTLQVYLPKITDGLLGIITQPNRGGVIRVEFNGWVRDIEYARVFDVPVGIDTKSCFHPDLEVGRVKITPYDGEVLDTQLYRPIRRKLRSRPR